MRLFRALFYIVACAVISTGTQSFAGGNKNVTLLGRSHRYQSYSNIWGYTAGDGKEYALLGTSTGLSIVDMSNPRAPREAAFVPGPNPTQWREIKTYSHYAYVVSEQTRPNEYSGIQVVDLSKLPQVSFESVYWPGVAPGTARAHSISVDDAGYLYIQGGSATEGEGTERGGVRIFSLADPKKPAPVGFYDALYVHDSFVKKELLFNSNIREIGGHVDILNISDRSNPRLLTSIVYPFGASHNSGTTEDGNYLITTDERTGATVKFWDLRALWDNNPANDNDIELVAEYIGDRAQIAHNVHVKGKYAFISHYVEGVKILDISDPRAPVEAGSYDTYLPAGSGFAGAWGVFPYFASGNFAVSDIQTGLYVFRLDAATAVEENMQPRNNEPQRFALSSAYPNPLRLGAAAAETVIQYELPSERLAGRVTLKIYDLLGREVRTLIDEAYRPGKFSARWQGLDQRGIKVPNGVYFFKLVSGAQRTVSKVLVVR